MNDNIGISNIIIIYQIIYLILYFTKVIKLDLISPLVIINIYIIFVMYSVDCGLKNENLFFLTLFKLLLLICVLYVCKFSFKNYFIGFIILLIYYLISDINKVYNCEVKKINLLLPLLISSLIYFIALFYTNTLSFKK